MEACGRHFSIEVLERIQAAVDADPSVSRRSLSREVCEWLDWRGPNGKRQEMSCRVALRQLHDRGALSLPECTTDYSFHRPANQQKGVVPEVAEVRCSLAELGKVEVVPVASRYSRSFRVWKGLMEEFHYLGAGPLCGAQIRYLVKSHQYGWLGCLSFSSSTWRLKPRDEWIGWGESARHAHLQEVVQNSRFLILPSVEVPNRASHVLSLSVGRLREDWNERYGLKPVLL